MSDEKVDAQGSEHVHEWVKKPQGMWTGTTTYVQACECGAEMRDGQVVLP